MTTALMPTVEQVEAEIIKTVTPLFEAFPKVTRLSLRWEKPAPWERPELYVSINDVEFDADSEEQEGLKEVVDAVESLDLPEDALVYIFDDGVDKFRPSLDGQILNLEKVNDVITVEFDEGY